MQKIVKKGDSKRPKDDSRDKLEASPRDEGHKPYHQHSAIKEIKTIIGGSSIRGLFGSLKKSY